jgi:hypothetical protein
MHTAALKAEDFDIEIDGAPGGPADIFPAWHKHSRFGIVIQEPLGAAGASLLIQAAITEHFRHLPEEWDHMAAMELPGPAELVGLYPEVYAFHVGRRTGELGIMDFWPAYKEIFVEAEPTRVLHEINGRGITVLAVPEGQQRDHYFIYPEHRAFLWRTEAVLSYSAAGRVADPDVSIRSLDPELMTNTYGILDPVERYAELRAGFNADRTRVVAEGYTLEGNILDDLKRHVGQVDNRHYEVSPEERATAIAVKDALVTDGHLTETYRRRDLDYALQRLVP